MPDLCGIDVLYQFVVCSYNGVIVHMVCGTVWCIGVVSVCGVWCVWRFGVSVYQCGESVCGAHIWSRSAAAVS